MFVILLIAMLSIDSLYYDLRVKKELDNTPEANKISVTVDPDNGILYLYDYTSGHLYNRDISDSLKLIDTLNYKFLGQVVIHFVNDKNAILIIDSGLGRVHLYDLNNRTLSRLDESYILRAFFGFSGYADGTDILAIGGEGEFIRRNQLIEFRSEAGGEWWQILNSDALPSNQKLSNYQLSKGNTDDEFLYFMIADNMLHTYTLSNNYTQKSSYNKVGEFEFEFDLEEELTPISFSDYNTIEDYQYLFKDYFYSLANNQVYKSGLSEKYDLIYGIYESGPDSVLVAFWDTPSLSPLPLDLKVDRVAITEMEFIPVNNKVSKISIYVVLFILILSILVLIVFKTVYSKRRIGLKIELQEDVLILHSKNTQVVLDDRFQINFMQIVIKYINKGTNTIPLEIFSEIFNGLNIDKSNESRRRKKIIDSINSKVGYALLSLNKDDYDNRKKVIIVKI